MRNSGVREAVRAWSRAKRVFVCLGLATALCAAASTPSSADVLWRSGARSVPTRMERAELIEELTKLAPRRVVVHLDGPTDTARRESLESAGIRLLDYLGGHAYFARLYGLTEEELRYILDPVDVYGEDFPGETFRVLKEKETRQYGEYRTRRLVLEAWKRMQRGERGA